MTRVAILGTGLIGTSIALALRERGKADVEIVGHDKYLDVARKAQQRGALHQVANTAQEAVRGADLVIFAAPLLAIQKLMEEVAPALGPDAVVTDTGSTKAEVLRWAAELLPHPENFVGSHPMAGKTDFGPGAAEPTLFDGARWVVVPAVNSTERAVNAVMNLAETVGAKPMFMDAAEHDAYAAAVSHMPMMAAVALFSMERASEAWPELSAMAAGGFRDMTRLSGTDPAMAFDIAVTNRENISHWLERLASTLLDLRDRINDVDNEGNLYKLLAATEFEHTGFRNGLVGREEKVGADVNAVGAFSFSDFLAGGWVSEKMREVMKDSDDRLKTLEEHDRTRRNI